MKQVFYFFALYILIGMNSCKSDSDSSWSLLSPDENVKIQLLLEEGKLFYTVSIKEDENLKEVIFKSPLGIKREDADFTADFSFVSISKKISIDEKYSVLTGKAVDLHNNGHEQILSLALPDDKRLDVAMRTYNDGIAFRYIFPEEKSGKFKVTGETTGFRFGEGQAWIQPYDDVTKWTPAYEAHYMNEVAIGENSPYKNGWCFRRCFIPMEPGYCLVKQALTVISMERT
jgi:alpha-glucosidase